MQNDDLGNWYKSSFEAINGKPAPDVWDQVEAALPPPKTPLFWPISITLSAIIILSFFVVDFNERNYVPNYSSQLTELDHIDLTTFIEVYQAPTNSEFNSSYQETNGVTKLPNVNSNKTDLEQGASFNSRGALTADSSLTEVKLDRKSNLETDQKSNDSGSSLIASSIEKPTKERTFVHLSSLENQFLNHSLPKTAIANDYGEKPIAFSDSKNKYIGINVGINNVTMLNNRFFKSIMKGTSMENKLSVKPTYSIVAGTKINESLSLEVIASQTNLGQKVTDEVEGVQTSLTKELTYNAIGLGIRKNIGAERKVRPYVATLVEARFLSQKNANIDEGFSNKDLAIHGKLGYDYKIRDNLKLGAGLATSLSLLNNFKGTDKIPASFNISRNLSLGLDLRLTRYF